MEANQTIFTDSFQLLLTGMLHSRRILAKSIVDLFPKQGMTHLLTIILRVDKNLAN